MTARHWKLVGGGEAVVLELNGEHVTVESSRPSPPGSTFEGQSTSAGAFLVKVRVCKRCQENPKRFRIEGRLVNLTRAQREVLQRSSSTPGHEIAPVRKATAPKGPE